MKIMIVVLLVVLLLFIGCSLRLAAISDEADEGMDKNLKKTSK